MDFRKFILFFTLVLTSGSCGIFPPKWAKSKTEGKQAVASEYHLSRDKFVYNDIIDTNAVYLNEGVYVLSDGLGKLMKRDVTMYDYYRFSSKGLYKTQGFLYEKPTDSTYNFDKHCQIGYYKIEGNVIKVETYNFDHHIFEYHFLKVQENGDLYHFKTKGRPWGTYTERWNTLFKKTRAKLTEPIVFPD